MDHLVSVASTPSDAIPRPVYRSAARTVVRVMVPAQLVLLALALVEVVTSGNALPLQLAATTVLLTTLPGMIMATEAVARVRVDGILRRMERDLGSIGEPSS